MPKGTKHEMAEMLAVQRFPDELRTEIACRPNASPGRRKIGRMDIFDAVALAVVFSDEVKVSFGAGRMIVLLSHLDSSLS